MIFLRPWVLVLLLVPFLFWVRHKNEAKESPWHKYIDKALWPYVLVSGRKGDATLRRWGFYAIWSALTIMAAGPAYDKWPEPSSNQIPSTVIIADLSPVMTGKNLEQLQIALYDLLDELSSDRVGLVVYDNKGYVVSPLTQDKDILRRQIAFLKPSVLPQTGSNAVAGFQKAVELLRASQGGGRILFVTAGGFDLKGVQKVVQESGYSVGILGIGSESGQPIPLKTGGFLMGSDGKPILVRLNPNELRQIGAFERFGSKGNEIQSVLDQTKPDFSLRALDSENMDVQADVWRDLGAYGVVLCLPVIAFFFRKGVVFGVLVFWSLTAQAHPFLRPDQEQFYQLQKGKTAFDQKQYQEAFRLFQGVPTAEGYYNSGNALAYLGEIEKAIQSYDQALKIKPDFQEAIFNKAYLERQLQKNKEQQNQPSSTEQQSSRQEQEGGSSDQQNDSMDSSPKADPNSPNENTEPSSQSNEEKNESGQSDSPTSDSNEVNQPSSSERSEQKQTSSDSSKSGESTQNESLKEDTSSLESANGSTSQTSAQESDLPQRGLDQQRSFDDRTAQQKSNNLQRGEASRKDSLADMGKNSDDFSDETSDQTPDRPEEVRLSGSEAKEKETPATEGVSATAESSRTDESPQVDQETQEIFNLLPYDPSYLLRYRLEMQNRRQP